MILLEVVEAERRKVAASRVDGDDVLNQRHPDVLQVPSPPGPSLPDYATSQAQAEQQHQDIDTPLKQQKQQRRLGKIIVYALAIYFILSISIAVPLFLTLHKHASDEPLYSQAWVKAGDGISPPPAPNQLPPDLSELPLVYGTAIECNNWTYVNNSSLSDSAYSLQYLIPSNETIYLRSNFTEMEDNIISPVTGSLRVSVANSTSQTDATISVLMKDIGEEALKEANVCLMRTESGWGLAIYVPDDANEGNYYFDVELSLPQPSGSPQLTSLATYFPSFNQTFESLDSYTNLESFTVQGSLGNILVESVHAQSILVKTSAANITGTFNASSKVILESIIAPIAASVSLYNEGNNSQPPTFLNVETGNSEIALNVTLYSNTNGTPGCPPMFMSSLKTFSAPLEAAYRHDAALQSSLLYVRAVNSLQPAQVFVDGTFEGSYDVHTTLSDAFVDQTMNLVDPTGAGRPRTYVDDYISTNRMYGWVGWGPRPVSGYGPFPQQGHVEVVSSLSAAVLQLTNAPDPSFSVTRSSKPVFTQSYPSG